MRRVVRQMRPTLDSFNFWVAVAYVGLVAVVVALFFINQNTTANVKRTTADEAAHSAEILSSARSRYQECVASIPVLTKINGYLDGTRIVDRALVANSAANLAATPPGSALYWTRVQNLARLERAARSAKGVKFPVPTKQDCTALRRRLLTQQ